jgi:hypothetical protein
MQTNSFCSDEDLAVTASADFPLLCPRDQALARGKDGVLSAGNAWLLTSASTNFGLAGVTTGCVVQLVGPVSSFRPPGECFGVVSASVDGVLLRRKGAAAYAGLPPGAPGLSNVEFSISTLQPQIRAASLDLDRRYGVNDLVMGRRVVDLFDPTELRDAAVYATLVQVYLDASRGSSEPTAAATGRADVWGSKSKQYKLQLDELLARVSLHWTPQVGGALLSVPTTKFGCRMSR